METFRTRRLVDVTTGKGGIVSESPTTGPYAEAASKYRAAGWLGVLPVGNKPAEKGPPPRGYTGHEGTDPTDDQVADWVAKRGDRNLALRLPKNVVGIDVDAYDGKTGGETLDALESELGPLPKTWVSTARMDGISGIRFFRVPEQFRPSRDLTGGIELVWHGHRYAVVAPSVHPATGDNYCWITPHGEKQTAVDPPKAEELAELPDNWIDHLTGTGDETNRPLSGPAHDQPVTVENKLVEVLADLAAAAETGGRHDAARNGAMALANLVVAGWPGAEEAMTQLGEAFTAAISPDRPREAADEWRRMRDDGLAKVQDTGTKVPTWKEKQDADLGRRIDFSGCYMPADFFDARPEFAHVRDAAHSRGRSADAVLATVLARLAADTDHNIQLPPTIGSATNLSLIVAPVGPPASGKSTAIATASDLMAPKVLKPECDSVPPGSGEGLLELLFDFVPDPNDPHGKKKIHTQVRHNAFAVFDEGQIVTVLAARSGNSLLPNLRIIFTSGTLGQTNATQERKRIIPPGQAAYGVVIAIQPDLVGPLFQDAEAGTPQRFLWAATTAPTPKPGSRPDWPGPLPRQEISSQITSKHQQNLGGYNRLVLTFPESVKREVEENDHHRQQYGSKALDEHTDLIRLKIAGLLAGLQGRLDISEEDWQLAGIVVESSRRVRDRLRDHLMAKQREQEQISAEKAARRSVVVTERTENWRVVQVAGKLAAKVHKDPGKWAPGKLRASLSKVQREWFDDALEHATDSCWVALRTDDTDGGTRERLFPGESKPS